MAEAEARVPITLAAAAVLACALTAALLLTVRSQDSHIETQLRHANSSLTQLGEQGGQG